MEHESQCGCGHRCGCDTAKASICCEVESCAHNDGNRHCTAQAIMVKSRMSILGEEAMCETYTGR